MLQPRQSTSTITIPSSFLSVFLLCASTLSSVSVRNGLPLLVLRRGRDRACSCKRIHVVGVHSIFVLTSSRAHPRISLYLFLPSSFSSLPSSLRLRISISGSCLLAFSLWFSLFVFLSLALSVHPRFTLVLPLRNGPTAVLHTCPACPSSSRRCVASACCPGARG